MKIQTKLLIPLSVLAIVLFGYIEFLWLPQLVKTIEHKNTDSIKAHMSSVITGLVPLLLESLLPEHLPIQLLRLKILFCTLTTIWVAWSWL